MTDELNDELNAPTFLKVREMPGLTEREERLEAENRAKALFLDALTLAQRKEWLKGYCRIQGSDGRQYTLVPTFASAYNVHCEGEALNARPYGRIWRLPQYCQLLAQKLLLETDAPRFREIACKW